MKMQRYRHIDVNHPVAHLHDQTVGDAVAGSGRGEAGVVKSGDPVRGDGDRAAYGQADGGAQKPRITVDFCHKHRRKARLADLVEDIGLVSGLENCHGDLLSSGAFGGEITKLRVLGIAQVKQPVVALY